MKFNLYYFIATIILFITEVLIATIFKDLFFVRAYLGDALVTILIYTFVKIFFNINPGKLLIGVFIFSVFIEVLQYFNIADVLGLKRGSIAYIVVGNSFSWIDIICYGAGCLIAFAVERLRNSTN
ncbi:DUF2809 domain-containing protein [Elizabethkingia anophelis]|uniref:ribosomal maturation YjgA family protein n=1 Tax=Elizabethkingia anophelis TaxID=1117645 RepID=UPI000999D339|nr:DUF2809 domain-containing protein [Elizabethkingia anophelis]MCT4014034.1 DUF2809 domain-containing protein [Elizabethkingia anophelis]MDV2457281.1 DUF2809 domain-containing protein [Elizabethkingia anophelis]MDV2464541.1 DUF2809 domain-containing protein [Elizabethkingia anophelis]MDV3527419.1 DUF2809 domain-containing protein [Elizabethkingia anophelis]MDV3822683.1 DUF2809 domain-containing protein [Elizabethkingia anophelis]